MSEPRGKNKSIEGRGIGQSEVSLIAWVKQESSDAENLKKIFGSDTASLAQFTKFTEQKDDLKAAGIFAVKYTEYVKGDKKQLIEAQKKAASLLRIMDLKTEKSKFRKKDEDIDSVATTATNTGTETIVIPDVTGVTFDPTSGVKISPLALAIAKEKGIDLSKVTGTGENGKVTKKDLDTFLGISETKSAEVAVEAPKGEARQSRMPEPETAERIETIIGKEHDAILALFEREDLNIVTHENPDLDSKAAIYLLTVLGGLKNKKIEYIGKGKSAEKGILIDVGNTNDLISVSKDRVIFDHHFPDRWVETSSTEIMLESLKKLGKIENIEPWMRNFANFVTEVDNMSYDNHAEDPKWFKESYAKTMLGLRELMPIEKIAEFFEAGKGPYDILTDEEMSSIKFKDWKGTERSLKDGAVNEQKKVKKSIDSAQWHQRNNNNRGLRSNSTYFGKILYNARDIEDDKHKIPLGAHAAYMMGYDSYATWDPKRFGYAGSFPGHEVTDFYNRLKAQDPSVIMVRGSMFLNYPDEERNSKGTRLQPWEYERFLGLEISNKNPATSVEYQVLHILKKQEKKGIKNYGAKLTETEYYFREAQLNASSSISSIEKALATMKGATDSKVVEQSERLTAKISTLLTEVKLWREKIALLQSLPKDNPEKYKILLNEANLTTQDKNIDLNSNTDNESIVGTTDNPADEKDSTRNIFAPVISTPDLNDEAVFNEQLETITMEDLELTLLDLGWPKEEASKLSIPELAKIIDTQKKYEAPAPAPVALVENAEKIASMEKAEREKKLNELFAEKSEVEAKLAKFKGTEQEHKDLMTRHYNVWAVGRFLQEGGKIGEEPKALTYNEIISLRVEKLKATGELKEKEPEPKIEIINVTSNELTPRTKLPEEAQIKILEEQDALYKARSSYEKRSVKFNMEGEEYAVIAMTALEQILVEQKTILEASKYAPYHAETLAQATALLEQDKEWFKNKFKKEFQIAESADSSAQPRNPGTVETKSELIERLKSATILTNEDYQLIRGFSSGIPEAQKMLKEILIAKGKKVGDEIAYELNTKEKIGILVEDADGFSIQEKEDNRFTNTIQSILVQDGIISLRAEKVAPADIFANESESKTELPPYEIKEIRAEILETLDSLKVGEGNLKDHFDLKDSILKAEGGDTLSFTTNISAGFWAKRRNGFSDVSFSGKFENTSDSIALAKGYTFTGGGKFTSEMIENLGDSIKKHLENKLRAQIEKIQIVDGKLKVTLK